jgi:hypothetical protein
MGIYPSPGVLSYKVSGASLNTSLGMGSGPHTAVVQSWDNCGGFSKTPVTFNVSGGVSVASPIANSSVSSPVHFVASASTSCPQGVSAIGIYPTGGWLAYKVDGANLDTSLNLSAGSYTAVVQSWDRCGGFSKTPVNITVGSNNNNTFTNLHLNPSWTGYALLPPAFDICSWCTPSGPGTTWSRQPNVNSPSISGNSTAFSIGGNAVYTDVLWNNHLIGDLSSQGMPDTNHTLVPRYHNFTYDVYFFGTNLPVSQSLEFDINQFVDGKSFIWGHECRVMGGHEWAIWNNAGFRWETTGIPCNPNNNAWNHLTIQVQRTADDKLLYQSITLNGQVYYLNRYYDPTPSGWWGITVNYQMDGNYAQQDYTVWLDNMSFKYW